MADGKRAQYTAADLNYLSHHYFDEKTGFYHRMTPNSQDSSKYNNSNPSIISLQLQQQHGSNNKASTWNIEIPSLAQLTEKLQLPPPPLKMATPISNANRYDNKEEEDGEGDDNTGAEQTGRWTNEEHLLFLDGLKTYGKVWGKI